MKDGMHVGDGSSGSRREGSVRAMTRTAICAAVLVPLALLVAASAFAATITSFTGTIGRATDYPYCSGSTIIITGSGFVTDGGVQSVSIGGVPAASFSVGSDSTLYALVGYGATTGPVVVTTPLGSVTSAVPETIYPCASSGSTSKPDVTSIAPTKAKGGKKLQLFGSGFVGTTAVTVGGVSATFAVPSDVNMYVIIPTTAKNGNISLSITNAEGTTKVTIDKTS
jgi:hypothetical protein